MDGRKDERDQTALADLDRYIHITWRQFRPAAICAQPPRKLPRAPLLLQVAKTRMELEGCEGQADSRQQWGAKGNKGLLQHPVCFLSNRSGQQATSPAGHDCLLRGLDRPLPTGQARLCCQIDLQFFSKRAEHLLGETDMLLSEFRNCLVECGCTQGEDFFFSSMHLSGRAEEIELAFRNSKRCWPRAVASLLE